MAQAASYHYPYLPVSLLLTDRYDSLHKAELIHSPVLILHGTHDLVVPHPFSAALFDALPVPKQRILFPGIPHIGVLNGDIVSLINSYFVMGNRILSNTTIEWSSSAP